MANYQFNDLPEDFHYTNSGRIRKHTNSTNHEYSWGVCEFCEKQFLGCKPRKNWKQRFCSRECRGHGLRKNGRISTNGYRFQNGRPEHLLIVEKVLGRFLKYFSQGNRNNEIVHHINMNKTENKNTNLLVCTRGYHIWLHQEYARAFARRLI